MGRSSESRNPTMVQLLGEVVRKIAQLLAGVVPSPVRLVAPGETDVTIFGCAALENQVVPVVTGTRPRQERTAPV